MVDMARKEAVIDDMIARAAQLPPSMAHLAGVGQEIQAMRERGEDVLALNLRALSLSAGIKDYAANIPEEGIPEVGPAARIADIALQIGLELLVAPLPPAWSTGAIAVLATIAAGHHHPEWLAAWGQLITSYPPDDFKGVAEELMLHLPVPANYPDVLDAITAMNERFAALAGAQETE